MFCCIHRRQFYEALQMQISVKFVKHYFQKYIIWNAPFESYVI